MARERDAPRPETSSRHSHVTPLGRSAGQLAGLLRWHLERGASMLDAGCGAGDLGLVSPKTRRGSARNARRSPGERDVVRPLSSPSECDEVSSGDDDSSAAAVDHPAAVWCSLLEGRLAIVERFDRDGCHHVVVRSTETRAFLSPREREVLRFVRAGYANKQVAIELGVSDATACALSASVLKKLGLRSRLELVRLFGGLTLEDEPTLAMPEGLQLSTRCGQGEPSLLLTFPARKPKWPPGLTPAERDIGLLILDGASTAEIARHRRTAERTTANQIASLLRKAGVASRLELASYVFGPRPGPGAGGLR